VSAGTDTVPAAFPARARCRLPVAFSPLAVVLVLASVSGERLALPRRAPRARSGPARFCPLSGRMRRVRDLRS
ncbi:hypothetical protein ACFWFU_25055, partial [Streptomyces sp. NPDC060235]|uniref:hypothetical protein n=1 Tax=Streptomyces sp. NPDC060235 TaxID=3347080 RepID=UPI003666C20B